MQIEPHENIRLPWLAKASPHEQDGRRYLYLEASNEDVDRDGEVVLQKALADSRDYFLRHGNIDLCHHSLGRSGIADYLTYEIGKPVEVRFDGPQTFVKAELYQGESPMAKHADLVWDSLTRQTPPSRWYPSIGGSVLRKSVKIDHGEKVNVIEQVNWNNIALDRQPINTTVPTASMAPIGLFAKSLNAFVFPEQPENTDMAQVVRLLRKALEASHATDMASLSGGGALGVQSLDVKDATQGQAIPFNLNELAATAVLYLDRRDRIATLILTGQIGGSPDAIKQAAISLFGLSDEEAGNFCNHFLTDIAQRRRYV